MSNVPEFRLLVVTDAHYTSTDAETGSLPEPKKRLCRLGCELFRRAVEDAQRRGGFDCIALLGDLTNAGKDPAAAQSRANLRREIDSAAPDVPLLVACGNHDADPPGLYAAFDTTPGLHEIAAAGGARYRFFTFADPYDEDDVCTRPPAELDRFLKAAAKDGPPVIVLQHNPMNPPIESDYPYMMTNREQIMADYARAGVMLSLSGHYHEGQSISIVDGVRYFTAPAVGHESMRYTMVTLRGREAAAEVRRLVVDESPPLIDHHCHTEFAYCRTTVAAEAAIERSRLFGLAGLCLTEHAPQLYCRAEDFWAARHLSHPQTWRSGEHSRMGEFFRLVQPLRDGYVRVGLEVELDSAGDLTIHDEDRAAVDTVIGAIHWLNEDYTALSDAELASAFMRTNERLLAGGVDILAHPWRFFGRAKRRVPRDLYGDLADMLAAAGTAAEVNFHTHRPDAAFFAICVERGVKIAFGSDAHALHEVASFTAYLDLLRRATGQRDVAEFLY